MTAWPSGSPARIAALSATRLALRRLPARHAHRQTAGTGQLPCARFNSVDCRAFVFSVFSVPLWLTPRSVDSAEVAVGGAGDDGLGVRGHHALAAGDEGAVEAVVG